MTMVFKVFSACGAEGGHFAPKRQWCSKISPPAALEARHFGAPKRFGFQHFSACGAEGVHFGPPGIKAPVVFKHFSACGAEGQALWAFRPQSVNGVQNFLRLRR